MIRQARSYLAGALSATALIAIAVVCFVVLVFLQALHSWPLAGSPEASGAEEGARAPLAAKRTRPSPKRATALAGPAGRRVAATSRAGLGAATGPTAGPPAGAQDGTSLAAGPPQSPQPASSGGGGQGATRSIQQAVPLETATGAVTGTVAEVERTAGGVEQTAGETGVASTAGTTVQEVEGAGSTVDGAVRKVTESVDGAVGKVTESVDGLTGSGN